jgi:oligopeptide/dipeptide ABC transporter ATP-binding protein
VEHAGRDDLYANPQHPYTRALMASVPKIEPSRQVSRAQLPGEMPSPVNPPGGCPFHPRCPLTRNSAADLPDNKTVTIRSEGQAVRVVARCVREVPQLKPAADNPDHRHACLLNQPG